jgi:hypothetical protein
MKIGFTIEPQAVNNIFDEEGCFIIQGSPFGDLPNSGDHQICLITCWGQ